MSTPVTMLATVLQPEPEPMVDEASSKPSGLKSPLKHKRLAMLQVQCMPTQDQPLGSPDKAPPVNCCVR